MCIALPRRIAAVIDAARMLVAIDQEGEAAPEAVSAALLVTPNRTIERLVGSFALIHAGFAISLVDDAEAQSRLRMFAALRGSEDALDLGEFYAATADGPPDGQRVTDRGTNRADPEFNVNSPRHVR